MTIGKILNFIPSMAQELPALVAGEPTTVDRLMLAASICGWITDLPMDYDREGWPVIIYRDDERYSYMAVTKNGIGIYDVTEGNTAVATYPDLPAETLADLGRAFLNAAIAKHQQENTND